MTNRLVDEVSPYLLQHAANPVDWFPWGPEPLAAAQRLDKPILLSIGYSACHWCHVMAHESFENETIAALMNDLFVNIKVDREERPDLDHVYQLFVQLLGRNGGWPLTVFLTPNQKPFFGGTYFPPVDRYGSPGFPSVLQLVADAYRNRRGAVDQQADAVTAAIEEVTRVPSRGVDTPDQSFVARAVASLVSRFDDAYGGFGSGPKFPNTMALEVLLRHAVDGKDPQSMVRVRHTLHSMAAGGIHDQLGGGFHRYCTDDKWLVPHFEKMLYDNALLLRLYADASSVFHNDAFARTARGIASYVERSMTSPGGGFYASEDADSEGEEGKFFVWDPKQVEEVLAGDSEAIQVALACWEITAAGNFEHEKTILSAMRRPEDAASKIGLQPSAAIAAFDRARQRLFDARERRVKPFRDEKILASWNGLLIGALATASGRLGDPTMRTLAERAFAFVERRLLTPASRVLRHTKGDLVKGPGFLDDYAFVADAALDLYELTGHPRYVTKAREIADAMLRSFWSDGFYFTAKEGEALLVRPKDPYDHGIPSGSAIACKVLLRLGALLGGSYRATAEAELLRLAPLALQNPFGMGQTILAVDLLVRGSVDIVVVGEGDKARALVDSALRLYLPNRTLAVLDPSIAGSAQACSELAKGKHAADHPVAYVCRGQTCSLPISDPEDLVRALTQGQS